MPAKCCSVAEPSHPSVRVYTLGHFQVEVDGAPLRFGRKAQRRPLDLLKLLVAYRGEGVAAEQIAEDLWPDAEGDAAFAALRTTLSRLRRLIGPKAVLGDVRGYTLNPQVCWVDALALGRCAALSPRDGDERACAAVEEALALYRGEFLPGDAHLPAVVAARTRFRALLLRRLVELGARLEQDGRIERAIELYRRGLEIDSTALDLARRLEQLVVRSSAAGNEMTVAVMPFEDLSPDGERSRLAEAVRETVISLLGALPQLSLVALPPGASDPTDRSGRGQGCIRYIVRGSVLACGGRLRAGLQLIDARHGRYVWSEQLDHGLRDANETRDQVAIRMAEILAGRLACGECSGMLLSPNVEVWRGLAQARVLIDRHLYRDHTRARALLGRILEVAPHEPLARAQLASMHIMDCFARWSPDPERSLRIGEKTLRDLHRRYAYDGRGMHALAWACAMRGDLEDALRRARKDVERRPENFFNHAFLGLAMLYFGQHAQGLDSLGEAVRVRPQRLHWLHMTQGVAQFCVGRHSEAVHDLATILEDEYSLHRESNLLSARMVYVANLAAAGRTAQAKEEARRTRDAYPTASARRWCNDFFRAYRVNSPAKAMERLLVASGLPH